MNERVNKTYEDIKSMKIRGALDIAISAVQSLESTLNEDAQDTPKMLDNLKDAAKKLKSARPTAVSLPNAIDFIVHLAKSKSSLPPEEFRKNISCDIKKFIEEQKTAIDKIATIGSRLIDDGDIILTHCNSDTVIRILKKTWDAGKRIEVFCTETRPSHQGYLSEKALAEHGIPTNLIVDSAAHLFMKEKKIDKIIVGADTVYASGETINKIGTSQIAICAKDMDIDFIVATESLKFSPQSVLGSRVQIEYRNPAEIISNGSLHSVNILNPAFDVTSADDVSVFVTEFGVIPPEAIYQILREKFFWELDENIPSY